MKPWDEITPLLEAKLDPKFVKPPPSGKYGEYLEAWHVINEANRIFGFDGWSYSLDGVHLTNAAQSGDKHHVGYFARVTVTVDGVHRSDVGHGQGHGKSEGDAHDSAVKEAVTDALKRALRTFGNPFGLALYDKTKSNVGTPEPPPEETRNRIKKAMQAAKDCAALEKIWGHDATKAAFAKLPAPMQAELTKVHSDMNAKLFQAPADDWPEGNAA